MVLRALSGFAVGVTTAEATELNARLSDEGAEVVVGAVMAGSSGDRTAQQDDSGSGERLVAVVADGGVDAVVFTSVAAVDAFLDLAGTGGRLSRIRRRVDAGETVVACAGDVTTTRARAAGFDRCLGCADGRPSSLVAALVAEFRSRTTTVRLGDGTCLTVQGSIVIVDGAAPISLTSRERALLDALARRAGGVVAKRTLLDEIWAGDSDGHVVEVTVARLRRRLGRGGAAIETVLRRGYRLTGSVPIGD